MAAGEDEVIQTTQPVEKFEEEVHEALHGPPGLVERHHNTCRFKKIIMRLLRLADFLKTKNATSAFLAVFLPSLKSLS